MDNRIEEVLTKDVMRFLMWKLRLHPKRIKEVHTLLVQFGWTQINFEDIPVEVIEAAIENDLQYLYSLTTRRLS